MGLTHSWLRANQLPIATHVMGQPVADACYAPAVAAVDTFADLIDRTQNALMHIGVYEQLLTKQIQDNVARLGTDGIHASLDAIDDAERAGILSDALAQVLRTALHGVSASKDGDIQSQIFNSLLLHLRTLLPEEPMEDHLIEPPPRQPDAN